MEDSPNNTNTRYLIWIVTLLILGTVSGIWGSMLYFELSQALGPTARIGLQVVHFVHTAFNNLVFPLVAVLIGVVLIRKEIFSQKFRGVGAEEQ